MLVVNLVRGALGEGCGADGAVEDRDAFIRALNAQCSDFTGDVRRLLTVRAPCGALVPSQLQLLRGQVILGPTDIVRHSILVEPPFNVVHESAGKIIKEFLLQPDEGEMKAQAEKKGASCVSLLSVLLAENGFNAAILHAIPKLGRGLHSTAKRSLPRRATSCQAPQGSPGDRR